MPAQSPHLLALSPFWHCLQLKEVTLIKIMPLSQSSLHSMMGQYGCVTGGPPVQP